MNGPRASVVIPVFNQLDFTRRCLESLALHGEGAAETILVDNGSTDGSGRYLEGLEGIRLIRNADNRGCAAAWNQGVRAAAGEWIVLLNNDVIVTRGWLPGLLEAAERHGLDIASPAIREGADDYDIDAWGAALVARMRGTVRAGVADGICFAVRRRVFERIGFFDENFRIGQFEDTDFFRRAGEAGFRLGTTGASFLHHFGSVTQDAIRERRPGRPYESENRAYFRRKWKLSRRRRLLERWRAKGRAFLWRWAERLRHGRTLKESWVDGRRRYR